MGTLTGLCVLLAALTGALTEDKVTAEYFTDGGKIELEVRPPPPTAITDILWKFSGNLLAEWATNGVPLNYYPKYKNRTVLAIDSGLLIISKMTKADEGVYSVAINNKVQGESYQAKLIKVVTKPKVELRTLTCEADSEMCKVTCDVETTGAGPVIYSWKKGDGEWKVSEKDITITKTDDEHVKTLTCRVQNPVNGEVSDPRDNPIYREAPKPEPHPVGAIVGGVIFVLLVLVGVGVGVGVAWKMGKIPFMNGGANITDSPQGNGQPTTPADSSPKPPETVPLKESLKPDATETA